MAVPSFFVSFLQMRLQSCHFKPLKIQQRRKTSLYRCIPACAARTRSLEVGGGGHSMGWTSNKKPTIQHGNGKSTIYRRHMKLLSKNMSRFIKRSVCGDLSMCIHVLNDRRAILSFFFQSHPRGILLVFIQEPPRQHQRSESREPSQCTDPILAHIGTLTMQIDDIISK